MTSTTPARLRNFYYYAIGNVVRNLASIALLPLYTAYLGPAEYGALDILLLLTLSISLVFGLDLGNGIFRHYCTAESELQRKEIIGTAITIAFVSNAIAMSLLIAASGFLTSHFLGPGDYAFLLCLNATTLVMEGLGSIAVTKLRADGRAKLFLFVNLARLFLQIAANVFFVVVMEYGLHGMMYGSVLSSTLYGLCLLPYSLKFSGFRFSKTVAVNLIQFGFPLGVAYIAGFYLSFGDRFFISKYEGVAAVGIYALAWKIAQAQSLLIAQPFQQMWDAERYNVVKSATPQLSFQQVFKLFSVALVVTGLGLSMFASEVLDVLADHRFREAADIVPMLVLSFILAGLGEYCRFGSLYSSNTLNITLGAWMSAAAITLGFFVLIPWLGVYGAAWAAVFGKALQLFWDYKRAKVGYDMKLQWGPVIRILGIAAICYLISRYLLQSSEYDLFLKIAFIGILAVLFWKSSILHAEEKQLFVSMLKKIRSRT